MSDSPKAETNTTFTFDEANEKVFRETLEKYPTKMAVLLPALWLAQKQNGHITPEIMEYIAGRLELSPVHVFSVVEFYTMYHKSPPGKFHLQLCRTLSCTLRGCEELRRRVIETIGIEPGQKSDDGLFSFEEVECLGSCGTAPVLRVNDVYCENMTVERLDQIIDRCRAGEEPQEEPMGSH